MIFVRYSEKWTKSTTITFNSRTVQSSKSSYKNDYVRFYIIFCCCCVGERNTLKTHTVCDVAASLLLCTFFRNNRVDIRIVHRHWPANPFGCLYAYLATNYVGVVGTAVSFPISIWCHHWWRPFLHVTNAVHSHLKQYTHINLYHKILFSWLFVCFVFWFGLFGCSSSSSSY